MYSVFLNLSLATLLFVFVPADLSSAQTGNLSDLNPLVISGATLQPDTIAKTGQTELHIDLVLDSGFHAYVDRFKLELLSPAGGHLSEFQVRPTVKFLDPISKKTKMGVEGLSQMVALYDPPQGQMSGKYKINFKVTYQACSATFCLLPKTVEGSATYTISNKSSDNLENALSRSFLHALLLVFLAGILTSFTPCIFPIIPITMAVLGTKDLNGSRFRGFLLSLTYVLGIAFTYSTIGVIVAKTGALFGALLGHPLVVGGVALIFVFMGLSMFELFEIQMPSFITQRLGKTKFQKGYAGAFGSGLVAGVIASPCVGPVLVSILAYVAKTQDVQLGFIFLFIYALGMGQIFLVLGTFQSLLQRLPRSGAWMVRVKYVFGVMMFAMAIYFVLPVLPQDLKSKIQFWDSGNSEIANYPKPDWKDYSDEMMEIAKKENRPVILDFQAEWCLACKELEVYTFSQESILEEGRKFLWLKFDATQSSPEFDKLQQKFGIGGLPFVAFFDADGTFREDLTLNGFEKADQFLVRMKSVRTK